MSGRRLKILCVFLRHHKQGFYFRVNILEQLIPWRQGLVGVGRRRPQFFGKPKKGSRLLVLHPLADDPVQSPAVGCLRWGEGGDYRQRWPRA